MNKLFEQRKLYNLRSQIDFITGPFNNGPKSLRYLGPKICNIIPTDIRNSGNTGELSAGFLRIVLVSYVLITSITLGMLIGHIFGTSHSEVRW